MSSPLPQPASPAPGLDGAHGTSRGTLHAQALDELVALGMDLARLVHAQAHATAQANAQVDITASASAAVDADGGTAAPAPAPGANPDPSVAFDRIARCVRRTILLAQHLAHGSAQNSAQNPAQNFAQNSAQARTCARKQLIRGVEDLIVHNRHGAAAEAMHREFLDRLDTPDLIEDDIASRPLPDLVKEICADLGLFNREGFTYTRRRKVDDLRRLQARAEGHTVPEPPWPTPAPRPKSQSTDQAIGPTPGHHPHLGPDIPPSLLRMATLLAGP